MALERREFARSATLVGAAERMLDEPGAAWPPDERPHDERTLAALTQALSAAELDRLRDRHDGCRWVCP